MTDSRDVADGDPHSADATAIREAVHATVLERAQSWGFDPGRVRATYRLNRGGFVNHSFHIDDGQRRAHLKVAVGDETVAAIRRAWELRDVLAREHLGPRSLDWITLSAIGGAAV